MQPLLLFPPKKPLLVNEKNWKDGCLSSFFFWLAACFSFVLDIDSYAFELTTNHLLNNQISSVQYLMTDWGKSTAYSLMAILWHDSNEKDEKQ